MTRPSCPRCNSSTGMGDIVCFKCGHVSEYGRTEGYFGYTKKFTQILELRDDVVLEPKKFSVGALKWLYGAGIYDAVIIKQGIGYCRDVDKVMIPAFCNDELMFYQLRSLVPGDKRKYITYGNMKSFSIHYIDFPADPRVVIVEDHISAIRLRKHFNVVSLNGTYLTEQHIKLLMRYFTHFIFWLDPDEPGQAAVAKGVRRLQYYLNKHLMQQLFTNKYTQQQYRCYKINHLNAQKDPKGYLDSEVGDIIEYNIQEVGV